jgi:threonyl-tRNA synthetase
MLIVGEQEAESDTVSVRRQGHGDKGVMTIKEFAEMILAEIKDQQ